MLEGLVLHSLNHSTVEVKVRGPEVQGHSQQHREFETNLGHTGATNIVSKDVRKVWGEAKSLENVI